jgi:hypothetical protein
MNHAFSLSLGSLSLGCFDRQPEMPWRKDL